MSDLKSKLPDLAEVGSMASKLYNDLKTSVCEIISDYKKKHPQSSDTTTCKTTTKKPAARAKKTSDKSE